MCVKEANGKAECHTGQRVCGHYPWALAVRGAADTKQGDSNKSLFLDCAQVWLMKGWRWPRLWCWRTDMGRICGFWRPSRAGSPSCNAHLGAKVPQIGAVLLSQCCGCVAGTAWQSSPQGCTSSPITCLLKNVVQLVHGKRQAESKLVPHRGEAGRGSCWLLSSTLLIF